MRQIAVGAFKARCLEIMRQVAATGEPVLVTRRGKPLARIEHARQEPADIFGFMRGEFKIVGDIESPAVPAKAWRAAKP